jgi:hypothetical protein
VAPAAASPRRRTPHRPAAAAGPFAVAIFAAFAVAAGAVVVPAAPAAAHGSDPSVRPVLDAVEPALPGVTVQLAQSVTAQMVVANPTPTTLSVLDGDGQPFLRIGPEGVLANRASPWWYLTNSPNGDATIPADAQPGAPPRWEQVAAEPAWGWFEHRLHPAPQGVPPDVSRARRITTLARWSVPFDYGGQPVEASGRIVYEPVRGAVTTRLRGSTRPFRDVEVQLAPGRVPALFLVNRGVEPVVVTGREGEPFLRLGPSGAEVNRRSPTWADDARAQGQDLTVAAAVVDPTAPPDWAPAAGTQTYSWLEFRGLYERDRPPRRVLEAGKTAVLRAWTVPLEQDGRRVHLRGETVWKPVSRAGD